MDLPGGLVGSLTLAVETPSLHHNVQPRLSDGLALVKDGQGQQIRHYWVDLADDINVLEARALCNALSSFFFSCIRNARIDVWTDNVTLQAAWENSSCRSSPDNKEIKRMEEMSRAGNFTLEVCPIRQRHCQRALSYSV